MFIKHSNCLYEASNTLIPKPGKDTIRKLLINASHEHIQKSPKF